MNKKSAHYATFDSASRKWLLILLAIFSIPAIASFFTDHDERSAWERRELAAFPTLKSAEAVNQYFSDMDLYINDHIGFALNFNRIYRQIVYYIFQDSPVENISYGKNGFTYLNSHTAKHINSSFKVVCNRGRKFNRLTNIEQNLDAVHQYFDQRGYPVSFGIAVTKVALYPDSLPAKIPSKLIKACQKYSGKDNILTRLHEKSTEGKTFHYPQKELLALKNEPYFYPKENFHWNGMSAHYFSRGLLTRMGIKMDTTSYDEKHLVTANADLHQLGFIRRAKVWHYPYKDYQVKRIHQSPELIKQYYKNVRDYSEFDTKNSATNETALVLSNSFGAYTAPHLAPAFKKLYHININHVMEKDNRRIYGDLIDQLNPDKIIFIFHDEAMITSLPIKKLIVYTSKKDDGVNNTL
jgi:hypothetical protein